MHLQHLELVALVGLNIMFNTKRELKFRVYDKESWIFFSLDDDVVNLGYGYAKGSPVMQFTGLQDKNGVDIYEGDIVSSGGGRMKKVIFYQGEYKTSISLESSTESIVDIGTNSDSYLEVIGNIYENPELIE